MPRCLLSTILPRMPFTSLPASSDAYRFASVDRLVEHDLVRHLGRVELLDRDAEDVALDRAEPVGRPLVGRGGDARVELGRVRRHGLGDAPRVLVHLALVQRAERRLGDVPLVEQEHGCAARLAAADRAQAVELLDRDTSTASTARPHMRASASATSLLHAARDVGEHVAVRDRERELDARVPALDRDRRPAASAAVRGLRRPPSAARTTICVSAPSVTVTCRRSRRRRFTRPPRRAPTSSRNDVE